MKEIPGQPWNLIKPISQGWRNILNVHTVAIIELQQKFSLQNVFVLNRKVELYSMEWQDAVDLSRFIVSAAPFGGKYIRLLLSVFEPTGCTERISSTCIYLMVNSPPPPPLG